MTICIHRFEMFATGTRHCTTYIKQKLCIMTCTPSHTLSPCSISDERMCNHFDTQSQQATSMPLPHSAHIPTMIHCQLHAELVWPKVQGTSSTVCWPQYCVLCIGHGNSPHKWHQHNDIEGCCSPISCTLMQVFHLKGHSQLYPCQPRMHRSAP